MNHAVIQLLMGFNVHLPSWKMIEKNEYHKVMSIEKDLHDIQHCVLSYVITNITYPSRHLPAQS